MVPETTLYLIRFMIENGECGLQNAWVLYTIFTLSPHFVAG